MSPTSYTKFEDQNSNDYPNPFFDLARNFIPKNIKTLFKYCRSFFYTNGYIRNIVTKLTEYPITDILFEDDIDSETRSLYNEALYYHFKIKELLISIGLDYYTFGNAFVSVNVEFKRYLKCNSCGEIFPVNKVDYKFKDFSFHGECPEKHGGCGATNKPFKIEDVEVENINGLNFVRWSPENIDIDYDELTGKSTYYYNITADRKSKIKKGDKKTVEKTPEIFLQALKENKVIELDGDNLYHFKKPTLAEKSQGWGKPPILPALKDVYYMQTLQRGNEAIANEHIVPKKAIFPAANGQIDPYQSMNLGKWKSKIESQVKRWRKDPNEIGIFPIPIGYQQLGGDGKMLMLGPELTFVEDKIITNMGLPIDFIKGGATWTGSSISLRIVENHFVPYREMLQNFLNYFVIPKLKNILEYPQVKVKFKKLKMSDDSETKQIMLNMAAEGFLSRQTLLSEFGINYDEEMKNIEEQNKEQMQMQKNQALTQAEAEGQAMVTSARYQARAQTAGQDEVHRQREKHFQEDIKQENPSVSIDSFEVIEKLAVQLSLMPPEAQERAVQELAERAPITAGLVLERFMADMAMAQPEMLAEEEETTGQTSPGRPKKQGQKKEDQVKPKGDKKKGQTKGNPA